jgi:glycerol uptake facilitator-like aquaporin
MSFARRAGAEALGAMLLTATVIGSGILADRFTEDTAIALLGNTAATGAILFALITALGPISGAHFNPAVTLIAALRRELSAHAAIFYMIAQVIGCVAGALLAHAMFELPLVQAGATDRGGAALILSEAAATFALIFTILAVAHTRKEAMPAAVALVICAGYWWTPSTSFANPAITIARAMTDTFAGLRPINAPGFVAGQVAGALLAWAAFAALKDAYPRPQSP